MTISPSLDERFRAAAAAADLLDVAFDVRYRGQAHELTVRELPQAGLAALRAAFEDLHEERYGYSDPDQSLELVTVRVSATIPGAEVALSEQDHAGSELRDRRPATLGGVQVELDVLRGAPPPGTGITGPAVVELAESTLLVPPGWAGETDPNGTIALTRSEPAQR